MEEEKAPTKFLTSAFPHTLAVMEDAAEAAGFHVRYLICGFRFADIC